MRPRQDTWAGYPLLGARVWVPGRWDEAGIARPRQSGLWHRLAPRWRTPRGYTLAPACLTGRLCTCPIVYGFRGHPERSGEFG